MKPNDLTDAQLERYARHVVLDEVGEEGQLKLLEIAALFDHLSRDRPEGITRERIGEAVVEKGLTGIAPTLKVVLGQILQGR